MGFRPQSYKIIGFRGWGIGLHAKLALNLHWGKDRSLESQNSWLPRGHMVLAALIHGWWKVSIEEELGSV